MLVADQLQGRTMAASRYLSDADAWVCLCAARLSELTAGRLSMDDCEGPARELFSDPRTGKLGPLEAAEWRHASDGGQQPLAA